MLNTYGYTQEAVDVLGAQPGIGAAEGTISIDALLRSQDAEEDAAFRLLSLPSRINVPELQAGRMPQRPGNVWQTAIIIPKGTLARLLTLSQANEADTLEQFTVEEFTIVGLCSSPLFEL